MDTPIDGTLLNVGCRPKVFHDGIGLTDLLAIYLGKLSWISISRGGIV